MLSADRILYCDRCGVEITWQPAARLPRLAGLPTRYYCCQVCMNAPADVTGPTCPCSERVELEDERRP